MRSLPLLRLGAHQCKWPLGTLYEPPRLFCAADKAPDVPYCPYHCAMAWARPRTGTR